LPVEAPSWLNPGDTSWQITAATLVGLMSVPGLAVLYGGVMQKRWSINSMILTFGTFSVVLVVWVLWGFKMGFGTPWHGLSHSGFFGNFIGKPGPVLSHTELQNQSSIPLIGTQAFPKSALIYFQFVFAAITRQHQGVAPVLRALDHLRVRRGRIPALGRRLLRPARCG
jgi:Amt family ammonium transporter